MHARWLAASLAAFAGATSHSVAPDPFDVEPLGDGVYALVRHDPIAYANNANSLIVVGDSGVLVVDAQYTRQATAQTIGAIRRITPKPVRYVVNTHWHDDHVAGNQVYRDTFPNVVFVSQENTRQDLATLGAANRTATWDATMPFISRVSRLMQQGLGIDSTPIVPLERRALESTVAIGTQYIAEKPAFRETLADMTFSRAMTVNLGARRIDIHYFGNGNTRGDAVVFVPGANVVATGDLLVSPVPFAFNAYPSGWIVALDSIAALHPQALLPGHGPVMRDSLYLRHVQRMLTRIRSETAELAANRMPLAKALETVTLADEREAIAHGDKWLTVLFNNFFVGPAVSRAYEEATRGQHPSR